jgi:hypothetical protein
MTSGIATDHQALMAAWADYRDGIYDGDVAKLGRIFHPAASLFFNRAGSLTVMPIAEYLDIVRNRPSPRSQNARRAERLISLAIPSSDNAVLTATILIVDKNYTDQLAFVKSGDTWLIVAKTYHLDS